MQRNLVVFVLLFLCSEAFSPSFSNRSTKWIARSPTFGDGQSKRSSFGYPTRTQTQCSASTISTIVTSIRGGAGGQQFTSEIFDWCSNLGGPAALVAGAVVATLYENVRGGAMSVSKEDTRYGRFAKRLTSFLLLSAFALEVLSIFITTVTGTMIFSADLSTLHTTATTPLGFLREHFEFEYIASRLTFLQGLLNWIAAVAVEYTIPKKISKVSQRMNNFIAWSLFTSLLFIIMFYNGHMNFYKNYPDLVMRCVAIAFKRYMMPPRPMALIVVPSMIWTAVLGVRAFTLELMDDDLKEA